MITTLAGQAYAGEHNTYTATRIALNGMTEFIEMRDGKWWVSNPAHEDKDFADKWNDYPGDAPLSSRGTVTLRR